jgi:transcription termination factor Rho
MSVLDRSALEASPLADLHAIASELSIDGYRRLRRAELIAAILDKQGGDGSVSGEEPTPAEDSDAAEGADAAEVSDSGEEPDAAEESAPAPRATRTRARAKPKPKPKAEEKPEPEASAKDDAADDEDESDGDQPAGRRRRGRRGGRGRGPREDSPPTRAKAGAGEDEASESSGADDDGGEEELVEGVVELLAGGSGFVRVEPPDPSDDDVYISSAQVKRCELVSGDRVAGPKRPPRRSERFASMIRIETINGRPASELADTVRFDDLPAAFPTERLKVGSDDPTLKAIEWLTPFGKGSRVTIVGAHRAGKTEALKRLAQALVGREELAVQVVLAGVRPEEITEWGQNHVGPAAAVSMAASEETQNATIEPVIDQARRLAARGIDAVVLIDSLDGCSPAIARKALAAARNIVDGGSLTVIATAAAPIGGETTVISLDVALASVGRFPALDLIASGTIRPELLVGQAGADAIARTRAEVSEPDDD